MYCVLLQFNSTIQTPLHDSTPLHSTPLHSAFYPIPKKTPTTIERYVYVKSTLTYMILSIGRTAVYILVKKHQRNKC